MTLSRRSILAGMAASSFALGADQVFAAGKERNRANMIAIDDPRLEQFAAARRQYWTQFGAVDGDVIGYLLSPELRGYPAWPTTRQAYLVVRTPDTVILASDGMSDLFVDTDRQEAGFGSEVFIETDAVQGIGIEAIRESWQFQLIENFAQNVADLGGFGPQLERYGILSMELPAPANTPARWTTPNGMVGALVNVQVPGRGAGCSLGAGLSITMVPLTLILPDELDFIIAGGAAARRELATRLIERGVGLSSPEGRSSVL